MAATRTDLDDPMVLPGPVCGSVELVSGPEHFDKVVRGGMLKAKVSLDISTADFKAMIVPPGSIGSRGGNFRGGESIISHLVKLADKGVEVRVLHAGVPSGPALRVLAQYFRRSGPGGTPGHAGTATRDAKSSPAGREKSPLARGKNSGGTSGGGLRIRRCPRLHTKAVIVDAGAMYLGSANLTGAGLGAKSARNRNFEIGVWTESSELIDAVGAQFNALWEGEPCAGCGRRDVCPVPLEEPDLG